MNNNYINSILVVFVTFSQFLFVQFSFLEAAAPTALSTHAHLSTPSFKHVPEQLKGIVTKMLELPEARELLNKASKDGLIGIVIQNDPSGQFDALWDGETRQIKLNSYRHVNEGSWICSILFELHNAGTNKHMLDLYRSAKQNQVSKEAWVEQMERMEHSNALNTCRLLEKGIAHGIYPLEARWTIFYSFDDYFKLQQISGHSHWLANAYDQSNPRSTRIPFQGTIAGLNGLSPQDKKDLEKYLVVKNNLENPDQNEALKSRSWLKMEYARLEECLHGKRHQGCFRTKEKLRLLRLAFK